MKKVSSNISGTVKKKSMHHKFLSLSSEFRMTTHRLKINHFYRKNKKKKRRNYAVKVLDLYFKTLHV